MFDCLFLSLLSQFVLNNNIHSFISRVYPPPYTWLTSPGPYRTTTCREREITLDHIHSLLLWPHKYMEDLLGWGISSMPGPSQRQHGHERRYTSFTHSFILTRLIWKVDYDATWHSGIFVGLKLPDNCLIGEEKHGKKPHPENFSRPGIEARHSC